MDSIRVTSSLGAQYEYHSTHAGKFKHRTQERNMITFLIFEAIIGECYHWQTTHANTSHTRKTALFTYTSK
jgi:hypothetical protein